MAVTPRLWLGELVLATTPMAAHGQIPTVPVRRLKPNDTLTVDPFRVKPPVSLENVVT